MEFEGPIKFGKRLILAGVLLGGTACSSSSGLKETPASKKCPTTIAEVSYLAGGSPEDWKAVPDVAGAWVFKSETIQKLSGPAVGRLYGDTVGRAYEGFTLFTTRAWYVCPEQVQTTDIPQNPS